jgi:hypothetical protein
MNCGIEQWRISIRVPFVQIVQVDVDECLDTIDVVHLYGFVKSVGTFHLKGLSMFPESLAEVILINHVEIRLKRGFD